MALPPAPPAPLPAGWRRADELPPEALRQGLEAAFCDDLAGPWRLAPADWPGFVARLGAGHLPLGRAVLDDAGHVQAFVLVVARPDAPRWRITSLGARPDARGTGLAPALLDDVLARARAAGQGAVELEVIPGNTRAERLYASRGFARGHALEAWRHAPVLASGTPGLSEAADAGIQAVSLAQACDWLENAARCLPGLPFPVTAPTLRQHTRPLQAWQCGQAQVVFSLVAPDPLHIHSLIDPGPGQRDAQALLQALLATHGHSGIFVPPLQRADLGGLALAQAGFERQPLAPWSLQRDL